MPSCHVCGGEEFEEEDGLFYCSECQTQSQVMHSVELEETDGPMSVSMGTLREIGKKQKSREHSEHFKNEYEAGRPWSKYEAYQLIMQAQADALVTHGARPSIKDAILRLWAKYLSQLGVAFTDNIRLVPKALEKIPWNRELNRGDFEHPEVNPRRLKRNIRKSEYMTAIRHSQKDKDVLDAAAALEGETFYKGDNPFDAEDNGGDDSSHCSSSEVYSDSSDDDPDMPEESGKKRKLCCRALYNLPERMCLRKTLVFCYLGCLFTSPWITLSDIIRWASEGAIPYLETTHLLHDDMKLTAFDTYLFRPRSLTNSRLLLETSKLANYLAIQKLPPFPVKWLISRFIVALDLPVEMHALVVNLYARMPVNVAYRPGRPISSSVPNVDAVCMAYIFVMLKIIFGLNDFTERQLSLYTQKVQTSLGTDFHLFDWSLWQAHITRNQQSAMDVDGLCKVFHNAGYEDQTFSAIKLYNATRRKKGGHLYITLDCMITRKRIGCE
ncbi:hypothetical protein BaRGS_00034454 [Batillaria attramentaria]|uniref:TATA box-binding protein-associated factor RNA polymerase I subunit B n=1 Tax=Batillaria attramentaria TaxID=370345 RepID=A0ABD0JH97_9CAEN